VDRSDVLKELHSTGADRCIERSNVIKKTQPEFPTFPGLTSSLAKVNSGAHFLNAFSVILWFLDVPKYSAMFHYIKRRWPAVYFKNQKFIAYNL